VVPAWRAYLVSETALTAALDSDNFVARVRARYTALREAGAATFYLHHFGEIVLRARPEWLPEEIKGLGQLRQWLAPNCTALRSEKLVNDVDLLADVADALKHAVLTRNPEKRLVSANDAVLVSEAGYGGGPYGEGKFGGAEQVLVLSVTGQRALSGVLQNVVDAWRRAAGQELPPIGEV
jgi:hypothetical protein